MCVNESCQLNENWSQLVLLCYTLIHLNFQWSCLYSYHVSATWKWHHSSASGNWVNMTHLMCNLTAELTFWLVLEMCPLTTSWTEKLIISNNMYKSSISDFLEMGHGKQKTEEFTLDIWTVRLCWWKCLACIWDGPQICWYCTTRFWIISYNHVFLQLHCSNSLLTYQPLCTVAYWNNKTATSHHKHM